MAQAGRPPASSQSERTSCATAPSIETDIAIIGGGLSGSLAAVILGRAGYRVTLIDGQAVYPPQFRVEKIAGDQVDLMRDLGLLSALAAGSTPFDRVLNIRRGHLIDRNNGQHYGIMYHDLVALVRAQIPKSVTFVVARVAGLEAGPKRQRVTLGNGQDIEARLIVLATGMADALRHKLGIGRRVVVEKQSLSFGFSIIPAAAETFRFPALTYYGEQISDRIDYLSLFPIGGGMRANLFTFLDHRDPWIRHLRQEPKQALLGIMPGLQRFLGNFQVIDKVQNWLMDLSVAENHRRDGVVLIGDAFQTSCPAAGTGVSRLLTDVDRLCNVHLPKWFASPGMGADKIGQFYDDPVKQAADTRAAKLADYRRSLTVDTSLPWQLHRRHVYLRRRVIGLLDRFSPRLTGYARALRTGKRPSAGKLPSPG